METLDTLKESKAGSSDKYLFFWMIGATVLMIFVIWGGFWLSSKKEYKRSGRLYGQEIQIGTETWPGYIGLYVARDMGFFLDEGINVEVLRYGDPAQLSKDYIEGKLHGRASVTLEAAQERLDGLDHKIVMAIDHSNGADVIVANNQIASMQEIRGKRVAYETGTMEELFISQALEQNGMSILDIVPVSADPVKALEMIQGGEVDVAVSHKPFLFQNNLAGNIHTIYTSKELPELITDVLTFRTDFIDHNPDTIEAILRAYFKALDYIRKNPENAHWILAKEFGIPADEINRQLEELILLGIPENRKAFRFATGRYSLFGKMREIGGFVRRHRVKEAQALDTDQLIEPFFIPESLETAIAAADAEAGKGRVNAYVREYQPRGGDAAELNAPKIPPQALTAASGPKNYGFLASLPPSDIHTDASPAGPGPQKMEEEPLNLQPNIAPVKGKINSLYGMRMHPIFKERRFHAGIDISSSPGTPVIASADGEIIYADSKGGYGKTIVIQHTPTLMTQYSHLKQIKVKLRQKVKKGYTIGAVGATGCTTGPHLHYEVHVSNKPKNPLEFISNKTPRKNRKKADT